MKLNLNLPWNSPATYRLSFGFANPNHAAAAICALFPFCWRWRRVCSGAGEKVASWYPNAESIEVESIEPLRILEINVDNQGKLLWFHSMRVLFLIHVKVVEE